MQSKPALEALAAIPSLALGQYPTPVEEMPRLRAALGGGPRLLVKRDDAISFGFGGNKVRKLQLVAARAQAEGADTLLTTGGVQSNHCRATAAAAARLGLRCALVLNGAPPARPAGNALLDSVLGAELHFVENREQRAPALLALAERLRGEGRRPFVIPLGASTPLGALAFAKAAGELLQQIDPPDAIVHSSSSGGTQAGLVAGCALFGVRTRVVGVSADDSADAIQAQVRSILAGIADLLPVDRQAMAALPVEVEDGFVGDGYGIPSEASREAQALLARSEALFVDHTYTAKAVAGLIAAVRHGVFRDGQTVLFWHTGGQVGLFA
jgi:1-aminocyclopropane-1-carboxylate deaminase/D-cysteine desulfhydrase-like pyridoxal-dependent ACC family enzyme